jgi:flagellar basal-body rod protein FlgB
MSSISFQNALKIHPEALQIRATRAEILANNLANADTPHFKARDIDFNEMLSKAGYQSLSMKTTHRKHLPGSTNKDDRLKYRSPYQPAIDGNTVDAQIEQGLYTKNSLQYSTSFQFLNSKFQGLKRAIKGQN